MRLLNVETFKLDEFFYVDPPPFAILSHTWGKDSEEVSYRDVLNGKLDSAKTRPLKLTGCCNQAKKDGYQYVWIDTCCIDKSNSVELQEAINSMFRWYQNADICYAFLADVPAGDDPHKDGSAFSSSRWFSRGWTLQELLAPLNFRFYDAEWQCMGTKGDLCDVVEQITGIPASILLGIADLHHASVAQRMSWVARRETKRQEDIAYCLLGIFGIFMPLIYGEGDKAFRRLQDQIMKDVGDDSIFAWNFRPEENKFGPDRVTLGAALAPNPVYFMDSGQITAVGHSSSQSFDLHGGSLRLSVILHTAPNGQLLGLLKCGLESEPDRIAGIPLVAVPGGQPDHYARQEGRSTVVVPNPTRGSATTIHLHLDGGRKSLAVGTPSCWFHIRKALPSLELVEVHPRGCWHKERALIEAAIEPDTDGTRRILTRFRDKNEERACDFVAVLEVEPQSSPRCHLMIISKDTTLKEIIRHSKVWVADIMGQRTASNGVSSILMELENIRSSPSQRRFFVKPVALPSPPPNTINATNLLQKSGVASILQDLRQASQEREREVEGLSSRVAEKRGMVNQAQAQLETVRARIKALVEEERRLAEEYERESAEQRRLLDQHHQATHEEGDISRSVLAMQRLLEFGIRAHDGHQATTKDADASKAEELMLPLAVKKGYPSLVRLLLSNGASVKGKDPKGRTALHRAVVQGEEELVRLLLDKGADVTASDFQGVTPLHFAADRGLEAMGRLLLDAKGIEVHARDKLGTTALHLAARHRSEGFVRLLLDRGAKASTPDNKGSTALHFAAERGFEGITRILLENNAQIISATDEAGKTAHQLAALAGYHPLAKALSDQHTKFTKFSQRPRGKPWPEGSPLYRATLEETAEMPQLPPYPDSTQMPEPARNDDSATADRDTDITFAPNVYPLAGMAPPQMPDPAGNQGRTKTVSNLARAATMPPFRTFTPPQSQPKPDPTQTHSQRVPYQQFPSRPHQNPYYYTPIQPIQPIPNPYRQPSPTCPSYRTEDCLPDIGPPPPPPLFTLSQPTQTPRDGGGGGRSAAMRGLTKSITRPKQGDMDY